jgi:hypothetical protein
MCTFIGGGPPSLNGPPKSKMLDLPVTTVFTLLESLRMAPATHRSATLASSYGSYRRRRKRKLRIQQINLLLFGGAFYAGATAQIYYKLNFEKNRQHTSKLTGQEWMEELLSPNDEVARPAI